MPRPDDPLATLSARPAVQQAVDAARQACSDLRWHPALRRRTAEVRTEACVRAAAASAELDGVRLPLAQVRAMVVPGGGTGAPGDDRVGAAAAVVDPAADPGPADASGPAVPVDPVDAVVRGALRASLEAHGLARGLSRAPAQVLARLHTLAAADLVGRAAGPAGTATLGRPRPEAAARVEGLVRLLADGTDAPGLVLAAVADAECVVTAAFTPGSGVLARALARTVLVGTGLDPLGVTVPERAALADRAGRDEALAAYASGGAAGVEAWVVWWGQTVVAGAEQGRRVADEVMAGRLA
ncbi:hypothetical protein [Jannaschia sp. R86511]|uniref:hypothetical protein n=1 Tax=Jannaschia sp. R86511 TaxID=3093853 RepID=UPI0036D3B48D